MTEDSIDIAIIGMAGRFPDADTLDAFWNNLQEAREAITFFSDDDLLASGVAPQHLNHPHYVKAAPVLQDIAGFDASFFGYSPREARVLDPQQRLFLEAAWHALEHAGYDARHYEGAIGVFAGASMNTYLLATGLAPYLVDDYVFTLVGSDKDFLATRVSYHLDLTGPSVTVQTACSTSW